MAREMKRLLSSEMVGKGHPDKMCDAIGDAILTAALKQDQDSRVAIETTGGKRKVFITGEITTNARLNYKKIAKETLKQCGYPNYYKTKFIINLGKQSNDIAQGVNQNELAAGDQGIMYGYATDETPNYMPLEHYWATAIALYIDAGVVGIAFGSDFKTQVTMEGKKIQSMLISIQHDELLTIEEVREQILQAVRVFRKDYDIKEHFKVLINPTGRFVKGWFDADAGTTGRKIVVDAYGSRARVGGGAFSGKDYTKVDRSAAYMARYVAKNLVANNYAKRLEIQVAYAIGVHEPVSIAVEAFGTNKVPMADIYKAIENNFSFRVNDVINTLNLKEVDYTKYSAYGHFGREDAPWERIVKL